MMETNVNICPIIKQMFDPDLLLDFLGRSLKRLNTKIFPLSEKKIRPQDIGKRRDFDRMKIEFEELYVRKKAAQEKYDKESKELSEKRPRLSAKGGTCMFKRMGTRE